MRRFERLGNLLRDRQRLVDRDRALRDPIRQRGPLDQLHDERGECRRFLQAVDRGDVRVIQRRQHLASRWNRPAVRIPAKAPAGP